tara:strand:+ start:3478 stop:4320 length:843 start_codon:yes stop_codon:yes gene_type:complete
MKTIGVIGNGYVGNAVAEGLRDFADVRIYDIDPNISTHGYNDTVFSEFVFVCLPTPMTDAEGGKCNLSILENFFSELPTICEGIFIIKSTVPIGTTDKLVERYPHLKIIHNPEFLTANNSHADFVNAERHVLGGKEEWVEPVVGFYSVTHPHTEIVTMKSIESECVKYFANSFLATKVMVFNEMKVLCESLSNVNYDKVIDGVCTDSRIGWSHVDVPGPDGNYGFGGSCFPKDINSLINTMEENGMNPLVLKSVWEQNKNYRVDWDWMHNPSAVLKDEVE